MELNKSKFEWKGKVRLLHWMYKLMGVTGFVIIVQKKGDYAEAVDASINIEKAVLIKLLEIHLETLRTPKK